MLTITGDGLTVFDVVAVADRGEQVEASEEARSRVADTHDRLQRWGDAGVPMYGVNTGFGELTHVVVPPRYRSELQANLLRSHAAGAGTAFPHDVVRAMLLSRLNRLAKGYSGVSPDALERMCDLLNQRIVPVVPEQGSLGASGDLAPLSHLALPLIGLGHVRVGGQVRPSSEELRRGGLDPLRLGFKEGLALVNGTSATSGALALALVHAHHIVRLALVMSAALVQCLRGSTRPYDSRGHELKNHAGQTYVAAEMRRLLCGSRLTRDHEQLMRAMSAAAPGTGQHVIDSGVHLHDAYSLRCVPQILGPVVDAIAFSQRLVEEELNSCTDNPLIFESAEQSFHGGNFHGRYVAMAADVLNIAIAEVGVLAERQLNRLLDAQLNGSLPAFLAPADSGLFCGLAGGQYLATSIASENLDLASPASVKSIPANGSNQDVVRMGLIGARKSLRLCEHLATIVSILAAACQQAYALRGRSGFSQPVAILLQRLNARVGLYRDDRPLADLLSDVRAHLLSDDTRALLAGASAISPVEPSPR
jgi:histidine ammonia-lyase/tyrosine ammonia-lyase